MPARSRRATAAAAVALLVSLFALSGFAYSQASPVCLSAPPSSPGSYTTAFSKRSGVWSGGDSDSHVKAGSDLIWLFGDTLMDNGSVFVNNSIVRQHGACFTTLAHGTKHHRRSALMSSRPGFLWPAGGAYNSKMKYMLVLSDRVTLDPNGVPGWNFSIHGSDITKVSFSSSGAVTSTVGAASPAPQDVENLTWSSVVQDGMYIYIYGRTSGTDHVVARANLRTFAAGPWMYWTGSSWSPSWSSHASMTFDTAPNAGFTVDKVQGGYLGSAKAFDVVESDVKAWFSPKPYGPWSPLGTVAAAATPPKPGWFTYGGWVKFLPGAGWVVSWSQNGPGSTGVNHVLYGPKFARVKNPNVLALKPRP